MPNVLITGASGNVGKEVIDALNKLKHGLKLYAGVKSLNEHTGTSSPDKIELVRFDFTDTTCYETALARCDILFLLRPPQISDVKKYFKPIIETCQRQAVSHIIFLSVQGVEKSKIIPHHKIEKLIADSKIPYTFLRPAYFMQNFTTTLQKDLINKNQIFLPAGSSKFTLIDVRDIGAVAALVITHIHLHINKSYELMSKAKFTFQEMAAMLSNRLGIEIHYISPNLIRFFLAKRKEKMPTVQIFVMIMLHYFPRFQSEPDVNDCVKQLTGDEPITFGQFINDNKESLTESISKSSD